jgi:hypothetical protein
MGIKCPIRSDTDRPQPRALSRVPALALQRDSGARSLAGSSATPGSSPRRHDVMPQQNIVDMSTSRYVGLPSFWHVARSCESMHPVFDEPVVHHLLSDLLRRAAVQPGKPLELHPCLRRNEEAKRHQTLPGCWNLRFSFPPRPNEGDDLEPGWSGERSSVHRDFTARRTLECHFCLHLYMPFCRYAYI